jgi:hypothetical protein
MPYEPHPLVEVGPPENVLLGPMTRGAGGLLVNKVLVQVIGTDLPADDRLPGEPIQNEFGFAIKADEIPDHATASVDGYLSGDAGAPAFVGFLFVVDSTVPSLLVTDRPQVSILRAQARNEDSQYRLELRGGITTPVGRPIGARPPLTVVGFRPGSDDPFVINDLVRGVRNLVPGQSVGWRFEAVVPGDAPERVQVLINGQTGPDGAPIASGREYLVVR